MEKNEDVLADKLGEKSYQDIVQLLTIHDIQLIVYTLEALYQLSELGESTTTKIASVRHAVGMRNFPLYSFYEDDAKNDLLMSLKMQASCKAANYLFTS